MLGALIELNKDSGGFAFTLFILGGIVWLWALVTVIRDRRMSDTDRIVWTVVLCTLNILGVVLYFLLAPSPKARTDEELKDHFNRTSGPE